MQSLELLLLLLHSILLPLISTSQVSPLPRVCACSFLFLLFFNLILELLFLGQLGELRSSEGGQR